MVSYIKLDGPIIDVPTNMVHFRIKRSLLGVAGTAVSYTRELDANTVSLSSL